MFDVDSIPLGVDFRQYLDKRVRESEVLLAIIGDDWLRSLDQHKDDPKDFVRLEGRGRTGPRQAAARHRRLGLPERCRSPRGE